MALSASHSQNPSFLATRRIEQLGELRPDWNGHGAAPISADSCKAAIRFLENAWSRFGTAVPPPTVIAPTPDGGVALEWIVQDGGNEWGIEVVCFAGDHYEHSVRNRKSGALEEEAEDMSLMSILVSVIGPRVANHFVLAR